MFTKGAPEKKTTVSECSPRDSDEGLEQRLRENEPKRARQRSRTGDDRDLRVSNDTDAQERTG
jgi:hypothetical protein